jgi:hypothetical protein
MACNKAIRREVTVRVIRILRFMYCFKPSSMGCLEGSTDCICNVNLHKRFVDESFARSKSERGTNDNASCSTHQSGTIRQNYLGLIPIIHNENFSIESSLQNVSHNFVCSLAVCFSWKLLLHPGRMFAFLFSVSRPDTMSYFS